MEHIAGCTTASSSVEGHSMEITLKEITARDLSSGYDDRGEEGVFGYGGRLDIRPPYQREFIYKDKQRDAVITTVTEGFPLNVMYWAVRDDGGYEVIDGQQRTISLCQYVAGDFAYLNRYLHNLQDDEQARILDYPLMIYVCEGTDSEKLDWFRTINIAGEKLMDQELRNAVYAGPWVSDAKRYFSKNGCPAFQIGQGYLNGSSIRQDYLEAVIAWISGDQIEGYMAQHQHDPNASALWRYFQDVITWVGATFTVYRKEMKGVAWGPLYNQFRDDVFDTSKLEAEVRRLIDDDEVQSFKGIYPYLLTRDERYLSLRQFDDRIKRRVYERQEGVCPKCGVHFEIDGMEADHITPWHLGGKTTEENCQVLCKDENRRKSGK